MSRSTIRHTVAGRRAFTLVEVLISLSITTLVLASALGLVIFYAGTWREAAVRAEADHLASMAISRIIYGAGPDQTGLRAASGVTVTDGPAGWVVAYADADGAPAGRIAYRSNERRLVHTAPDGSAPVEIGRHIAAASAVVQHEALDFLVRVDLDHGRFRASRELATTVRWRN